MAETTPTTEPNRNPYVGIIPRTDAVLYIQACGYRSPVANEMIKDYTHGYGNFVDPEVVPDHVNSIILNGYDELQYMMKEFSEEFRAKEGVKG